MNLNNFYVLVDTKTKNVIDKIQKLPENWSNISGLPSLSDEKLCNLEWAGHHDVGWINISSELIKEYTSSEENLELNKNTFKLLVSNIRKEKQEEPIEYCGAKIKANSETRYSLYVLREKGNVNYKCINGYFTFTSLQIEEIYSLMEEYIQNFFDTEMKIYIQIDKCQSISDFFHVDYTFK